MHTPARTNDTRIVKLLVAIGFFVSTQIGTPITPVDAGSTCVTGRRRSLAAAFEAARATASPPVRPSCP